MEMSSRSMECLDVEAEDRFEGIQFIAARAVLDTIIVLLIIGGNAFIVFAIVRYRRRKNVEQSVLCSASMRFALNLAVADFLVGVSTTYYLSSKYLCSVIATLSQLEYLCLSMFVMIICAHATSAYTIVAIAIDRYIAVVHALRYKELMSTRTSRIMVAAVWVFSVSISTPVFYWNQWSSNNRCEEGLVVPLTYLPVMTLLSHCIIMGIVGGFHRRIHREALASRIKVSSLTSEYSRSNSRFSSKSAKVLLLVTGCYIICWTPITIAFFIRGYVYQSALVDVVYNYSFTFLNINYLFNPVVYSWMNPSVRTAILDLLKTFKCNTKCARMNAIDNIGAQNVYPSALTVYSVT